MLRHIVGVGQEIVLALHIFVLHLVQAFLHRTYVDFVRLLA